ncbi:bifunctional epoxide hydrolase 2 [Pelobates cultripes]|uniref:Bifunctional epoxide hydrolase 2 n=1 Tax=Pelobates cultripes TaxID=61616 RepID=A0AAD1R9Y8_PELCU|nr:bifunctional epoxide hydrolase 2 [Pelobates cultripes]
MSGKRVVLFDLGGVLLTPGLQVVLQRLEESLLLHRGFLSSVFLKNGPDGYFAQAERGQIPLSKLITELNNDCKTSAEESGITLPESFSLEQAFHGMYEEGGVNKPMLEAAVTLRNHGFKTCILTNNWVDDSPSRSISAKLISFLHRHFDLIIESCRIGMRKPESKIYEYALQKLQAKPDETIFLDDIGANLKPAREMGISTVLVKDTDVALKELQELTGIQLIESKEFTPTPASPENVTHGFVTIKVPPSRIIPILILVIPLSSFKPGVKLHFVEMGSGPAICLCHGFPESWYSWRYQIPALADGGYRVLALDMKGYGDSSAPAEIEEYSQEELCKGLVVFLDKLSWNELVAFMGPPPSCNEKGISQATFIGHDWGGAIVWNMALFFPERVRAVASLNTPFFTADPKVRALDRIKANPLFDYQLYFQEPGVAEAELERNLERTFKLFFQGSNEQFSLSRFLMSLEMCLGDWGTLPPQLEVKWGGIFVGAPEDPPLSVMLKESDVQFYINQFKKSGFRGPLNWYRNIDKNWQWSLTAHRWKILVPALMVTAGRDPVLLPIMTRGMEDLIPNLSRENIEECGHWTQMERPAAVNKILIKWLGEVHLATAKL